MRDIYSLLDEAKYNVVHDYPRGGKRRLGATGLGPLVGIKPGTLSNKVNPTLDSHHLTVDDAIAVQYAAKDFRILYTEAHILNHACIPFGDFDFVSDVALLDAYIELNAEFGELAFALKNTLADGRVKSEECQRVKKEFMDVIQAGFELLQRLEGLIDDQDV